MLQKSAIYRKRAEEVRQLASEAVSDGERATLMDIAETWDKLAHQRDEYQLSADTSKPEKKR